MIGGQSRGRHMGRKITKDVLKSYTDIYFFRNYLNMCTHKCSLNRAILQRRDNITIRQYILLTEVSVPPCSIAIQS